ncbi:hypothetical protein Dimus_036140 [Dionaea muscipula]
MDGRPTSRAIDGEDMDRRPTPYAIDGEDMDRRPTPHAIDEETDVYCVAHDPSNINRLPNPSVYESSSIHYRPELGSSELCSASGVASALGVNVVGTSPPYVRSMFR